MSVVNQDWRDPTAWAPSGMVWTAVRDGGCLHLARRAKGGRRGEADRFSLSMRDFRDGAEPARQLHKDLKSGACLAAGLDPTVVVLRTLRSPLKEREKSAELWPGLLDASLPFPLEECMVVFSTPRAHPEGGWVCDAYAARQTDLESELNRWRDLGLQPALLLPEAGLFAGEHGLFLWRGDERALAFHRNAAEDAACMPLRPEGSAFQRFCLGRKAEETDAETLAAGELALRLADAVCAGDERCLNLRADALAAPELRRRYDLKQGLVKGLALLMTALALLLPTGITRLYRILQGAEQTRIRSTFREVTGQAVSAPGQERLLAERWLAAEGGAAQAALEALRSPQASLRLGDVLRACQLTGARVRSLRVDGEGLELEVLGPESSARGLEERLRPMSRHLTRETLNGESNLWRFRGEGWL